MEFVFFAVSVVAAFGKRASEALVIGAGEVVESEAAFVEMDFGEGLLDAGLASQEPPHGSIDIV